MNWYLKVIRQYADFNGRARRTEYWMFVLFNVIFAISAFSLDIMMDIDYMGGIGPLYTTYMLFIIIPSVAVAIRRLHDTGKSGWMLFVSLIPVIGGIWLLVLYLSNGDTGDNEYGPDPKI